ncbi:hypothetical protein N8257_00180 [Ulvibacter sp.]|nr:hypothetical protein [Ulvibacter sp.]
MTQISDYDIATVENTIQPDLRYTAERNKQSFDVYLRGTSYREVVTEKLTARLIAKRLGLSAEEVTKTAHSAPYDVEYRINRGGEDKTVRVEVKATLAAKTHFETTGECFFEYKGVKPEKFDYIFFYEVHPHDGLIVKWTTQKEIFDFVQDMTKYKRGYNLCIKDLRNSDKIKLYDIEDFPPQK